MDLEFMDAIHLPCMCFPCGLEYEITFGKQTASQNLKMMSQALEVRLPPPESKLEYTPWNSNHEDMLEDEKEVVDLNFL